MGRAHLMSKKASIDRGWAWVVLAAFFSMTVFNAGYIKCFGILFLEIEQEYQASASMASLVMGIHAAASSVTALVTLNVVVKRISIRRTSIIGAVILSVGVFINAFAPNIYVLILSQGILAGMGNAMLYGPGIVQVGQYFEKRRAFATAVCSCGVSVGGMVFPPLAQRLISVYGLHGGFIVMSGLMSQMIVFVSLYRPLPRPPKSEECKEDVPLQAEGNNTTTISEGPIKPVSDGSESLIDSPGAFLKEDNPQIKICSLCSSECVCIAQTQRTGTKSSTCNILNNVVGSCVGHLNITFFKKPVYLLIFGFTAFAFLGVGLFPTFIPPFALEKGENEAQAATFVTIFNALELVSRLIAGFLAEVPFIKRHHLIVISLFLLGTLNQVTYYFSSTSLLVVYVSIFGILNGLYPALHPAVIIDFVGMGNFPQVFGFVQVFHGAIITACYPIMGVLRDLTGTYSTSLHFLGSCKLLSAMLLLLLPVVAKRNKKEIHKSEV